MARALAVGAAVTLGFVAVFTTIGALISHLSLAVDEWFPWMTIVVGVGVLALGVALLAGFELRLALPHLERGGRERTLPSMFVFGVSYAVASLSCTLPGLPERRGGDLQPVEHGVGHRHVRLLRPRAWAWC